MVMRDNVPSPPLSELPSSHADLIKSVPGVRVVAPEVWKIAPTINGTRTFGKTVNDFVRGDGAKALGSLLDMPLIQGQDIPSHQNLRSGVYPTSVKEKGEGRFLIASDVGTNHVVISRKLAKQFPQAGGKASRVGDKIKIKDEDFEIVGLYDTGSMFLDVVIVMDIGKARQLLGISKDMVSTFYVEMDDPSRNDAVSAAIESKLKDVDARSMNEFMANFGVIMGQLDTFLLMTVSLALLSGSWGSSTRC